MRIGSTIGLLAITLLSIHGSAQAAIVVDGSYDNDYGLAKSTVTYDPLAPTSNFGTPTPFTNAIGYKIYLKSENGSVYGLLQASAPNSSLGAFANLYFDLDPAAGNGSDLGFELAGNHLDYANAFIPGVNGSQPVSNITTAVSSDGLGIEFAIPDADFETAIPGLDYLPGHSLAVPGGAVTLRLSQSFGYSVAGGALYGPDRLGSVDLSAVPLPASLPLFGAGLFCLGVIGVKLRGRERSVRSKA